MTPGNPNAAMTSYASNYQNVAPGVHPSEPNYVWQESGIHGPLNDSDPYPEQHRQRARTLSALLAANTAPRGSRTRRTSTSSTTSGINVNGDHGAGTTLDQHGRASRTSRRAADLASPARPPDYTNPYNGSHQYNYAAKHNRQVFFTATNGAATTRHRRAIPRRKTTRRCSSLQTDLNNNTVAHYNWITPDQYNDMHSALNTDFTYNGVTYTAGTRASRSRSATISCR